MRSQNQPEQQSLLDSLPIKSNCSSTSLETEVQKIRQESYASNVLEDNKTLHSDSECSEKLARKRSEINRELSRQDNCAELGLPLLTGFTLTVRSGGRYEYTTAVEAATLSELQTYMRTIAPGPLNMQYQEEIVSLKNGIVRRGRLKEIGAITAAVTADYFIDNYAFKNQQSRAATYFADAIAPFALSRLQWQWKIGGMILSHVVGKLIDSFNQPKYRFNPQDPQKQTLPEYLKEHPTNGSRTNL